MTKKRKTQTRGVKMDPKLNLTKFMQENASGSFNISVEKIANGMIVNLNSHVQIPNADPGKPSVSEGANKRFAFTGTAAEIHAKISQDLPELSGFFEV